MKIVHVRLKKIRITSFSPKSGLVEIEVSFDDGKLKQFHKSVRIEDPGQLSRMIIDEIKNVEKSAFCQFDGERFLDSITNIVFEGEEDVEKQMSKFFLELAMRIEDVAKKRVAEGYLDAITRVRSMRLEFD